MKLVHHSAFSLTLAGMIYLIFKSWGLSLGCLIAGIFIDLDHIYDYMREHGRSFNMKEFFHVNYNSQYDRVILFLHGWEWVFLGGIAAWLTEWNPWITGGLIGLTQHLVLDAVYNGSNLMCYSLFWRWTRDFELDTIFPKSKEIKYKYR